MNQMELDKLKQLLDVTEKNIPVLKQQYEKLQSVVADLQSNQATLLEEMDSPDKVSDPEIQEEFAKLGEQITKKTSEMNQTAKLLMERRRDIARLSGQIKGTVPIQDAPDLGENPKLDDLPKTPEGSGIDSLESEPFGPPTLDRYAAGKVLEEYLENLKKGATSGTKPEDKDDEIEKNPVLEDEKPSKHIDSGSVVSDEKAPVTAQPIPDATSSVSVLKAHINKQIIEAKKKLAEAEAKNDAKKPIRRKDNRTIEKYKYIIRLLEEKLRYVEDMQKTNSSAYGSYRLAKKDEKFINNQNEIEILKNKVNEIKANQPKNVKKGTRQYRSVAMFEKRMAKLQKKNGKIQDKQKTSINRKYGFRKLWDKEAFHTRRIATKNSGYTTAQQLRQDREGRLDYRQARVDMLEASNSWYKNMFIVGNKLIMKWDNTRLEQLQRKEGRAENRLRKIEAKYEGKSITI